MAKVRGGTPHISLERGGDTAQKFTERKEIGGTPHISIEGGDTAHKFTESIDTGGTPHISNYRSVLRGWMVYQDNNATPWLHLASWNLPDSQLS